MKKLVCMMIAVLMCVSLILPVAAADSNFIPSVGVTLKSAVVNGEDVLSCLAATTVGQAKDQSTGAAQADRDALLSAYEALSAEKVAIPLEGDFEVTDMFLLSVAGDACADLAEELKKDDVAITLTLESELPESEKMTMMVFVDGKWGNVADIKNNDDGTVTCTLPDLGPVIFVKTDEEPKDTETGENSQKEEQAATERETKGEFVPSISYKSGLIIVDVTTNIVVSGDNTLEDRIGECIVATSVGEAKDKKTDISQEDRDNLIDLYTKLSDGSEVLPLEKDYVIRDLIDINFFDEKCRQREGHQEKRESLKEEGVTLTVTFQMGIPAKTDLIVMGCYDGKWEPVKEVINNGDGTVTCVLEDVSPLAFVVENVHSTPGQTPWTGDAAGNKLGLWIGLMVICAAGVVGMVALKKKQK